MNLKSERSWKKVYESDLEYVAIECKDHLPHKSVVVLEGEMGAGKTSFCKVFVNDPTSNSPSYSIINEYPDTIHGDFYRLEDSSEVISLELDLYMEGKSYLLIEWGLKFINRICSELSDDFEFYLLQIEINEKTSHKNIPSRNFYLKKITDL